MDRVKNKVVIITGAASGLGEADARMLAAEGARVVMTDINVDAGQTIANEIGATFYQQDVALEESWHDLMGKVEERYGQLDALVNNAGVGIIADIETTTTEVWRKTLGYPSGWHLLGLPVGDSTHEEKWWRLHY